MYRFPKRILLLLCSISIFLGCKKDIPFEETNLVVSAVRHLNENVDNYLLLSEGAVAGKRIAKIQCAQDTFTAIFEDGNQISIYNDLNSGGFSVPCLSIVRKGDYLLWCIQGDVVTYGQGENARIDDELAKPVFSFKNGTWFYTCRGETKALPDMEKYGADWVTVNYDGNTNSFVYRFPCGEDLKVFCVDDFSLTREDVLNEAYYKDIFLDSGVGLHSRKHLAAADYLKMSMEGMCFSGAENAQKQNTVIDGNDLDYNGRLLYPDGQPRYKVLLVVGGNSRTHGRSFSKASLEKMRSFYHNGGSYVGTCAGAFFASNGYDDKEVFPYYLGISPSVVQHTGLSECRMGMSIEPGSALLNYYDFGGDNYVASIYHSGGGYPLDIPDGMEILARYDYKENPDIHKKASLWAYKDDNASGRVVLTGSHPEIDASGERRDLMASMIQYAIDGRGAVSLKGILENGVPRRMDKESFDNMPDYTKIGDLQCHHFAIYIPYGNANVSICVESDVDCDLSLMISGDTYAFPETASYSSTAKGRKQSLTFPSLRQGVWYVAVKCLTTVDVTETEDGQDYSGRVDVLNGVSYTITATWQ